MVESTITQEAYFLRSAIHKHHNAAYSDGEGPESLQSMIEARNKSLIRLLELRKEGPLPFAMDVTLNSDPLVEEIHPFSLTPFRINLPTESHPESPFTISMDLADLGKATGVEDSTKTLELLGDFGYSGIRQSRLLIRTVREIQAIEDAQSQIPAKSDNPRRRELRELRDKLIIERFLFAQVNNKVPVKSELKIKKIGEIILVMFQDDRNGSFKLPIEAPIPGKYSDERNAQLQDLLEQLDLAA